MLPSLFTIEQSQWYNWYFLLSKCRFCLKWSAVKVDRLVGIQFTNTNHHHHHHYNLKKTIYIGPFNTLDEKLEHAQTTLWAGFALISFWIGCVRACVFIYVYKTFYRKYRLRNAMQLTMPTAFMCHQIDKLNTTTYRTCLICYTFVVILYWTFHSV